MFGNKERLSYLWDMNETNTPLRFTDLLNDAHFVAIFQEWEYLESINDDGSHVLWDYMVEKFNYEA